MSGPGGGVSGLRFGAPFGSADFRAVEKAFAKKGEGGALASDKGDKG
jgi:hypothetical protein